MPIKKRTRGLQRCDAGETIGPACCDARDIDPQPLCLGLPQLIHRADCHHAAVADDADPVAQLLDQLKLVTGEQHRDAGPRLVAEHRTHHIHGQRIETGEWLVEDQDLGPSNQRRRELDALLIAVAQRLHLVAGARGEAQPLQPARGVAPCLIGRCAM